MLDKMNAQGNEELADDRRPWLSVKKKILFALLTLLALFLLVEIGVRILDLARGVDPSTRLLTRARIFYSHPFLNVELRPGTKQSGSMGFRGHDVSVPKPAGKIRIFCLGGSTTYGHGLPAEKSYPAQLDMLLKEKFPGRDMEVVNAGVPTYCSLSSLINLQCHILPLQLDIICVYHGANDMWPIMSPDFKPDYTHFYKDYPDDSAFDAAAGRGTFSKILECSRLFQILRYKYTDFRKKQGIIYYAMHQPRDKWAQETKVSEQGIENFRRNIKSIVAVAREHKVKVVLATFAFRESIMPTPAQAECYKRMNNVIREAAESENVFLADVFSAVPDEAGNYCNDDIHLSEKGSKIQAKVIADAMEAAGLMGK
ncbi:MAG: SGNH/GDSL hydrolase family protein [Planctomycetota bacterium]